MDKQKLLQTLPVIMALSFFSNTLVTSMTTLAVIHYVGLLIVPAIYFYVTSYMFNFNPCIRICMGYIFVIDALNITDFYFGIPISSTDLCAIHVVIALLFIEAIVFKWFINEKEKE